jgi:hypothetical protein
VAGKRSSCNLLDDVKDQAIIYRKGILPVAVKVLTNISN